MIRQDILNQLEEEESRKKLYFQQLKAQLKSASQSAQSPKGGKRSSLIVRPAQAGFYEVVENSMNAHMVGAR